MPWPLIRLLPREFHFNFVRLAPYAAVFSALLIAGSIGSFAINRLNLGIDFAGGVQMEVDVPAGVSQTQLRSAVGSFGVEDPFVGTFPQDPRHFSIRFKPPAGAEAAATPRVKSGLVAKFPGLKVTNDTTVGAKVSGELFQKGFMALVIAMALMLGYIWF
ncbi:MAG: protein-export rane protein SecF, partial [Caulobacteraceae bacterium]|nr:protein-export rane protein SecF [Caulobacteraceae bacterium]